MPKLSQLITLFVGALLLIQGVLAPAVQAAEGLDASFKCHQELSLQAQHLDHTDAQKPCPETDHHCQECHVHILVTLPTPNGQPDLVSVAVLAALNTATSHIYALDVPPPKFA